MEKRRTIKRPVRGMGLNGMLWRYLTVTGTLSFLLCLAWLFLFNILVNMGFVMSAYTAVRALPETEKMLLGQERFDPGEIPFFYKWALAEDGSCLLYTSCQKPGGGKALRRRQAASARIPGGI